MIANSIWCLIPSITTSFQNIFASARIYSCLIIGLSASNCCHVRQFRLFRRRFLLAKLVPIFDSVGLHFVQRNLIGCWFAVPERPSLFVTSNIRCSFFIYLHTPYALSIISSVSLWWKQSKTTHSHLSNVHEQISSLSQLVCDTLNLDCRWPASGNPQYPIITDVDWLLSIHTPLLDIKAVGLNNVKNKLIKLQKNIKYWASCVVRAYD
jgi:hypothetical protein